MKLYLIIALILLTVYGQQSLFLKEWINQDDV